MDIEDMCEILEEFSREFTDGKLHRDFFSDFLIYNDLGLPMAQAYHYDLVEFTQDGEVIIIDTWESFCRSLNIDSKEFYEDLQDCIFSSDKYPNDNS